MVKKLLECDVILSNFERTTYVFDISNSSEFCEFMVLINDAFNDSIIRGLTIFLIER